MGGKFQFEGIAPCFFYYIWPVFPRWHIHSVFTFKIQSAVKIAVFGFMNPVFGVMLSALLLKEKGQAFSLTGLTSLILVCIGIYIVNRENPLKEASTDKISV